MSTNFWDGVVQTEQKAKALIEKAREDKEQGILAYQKKLSQEKEAAVVAAREQEREVLKEKQKASKKSYEDLVKKGSQEAENFQSKAEGNIKGELNDASDYFFKTLLGIS